MKLLSVNSYFIIFWSQGTYETDKYVDSDRSHVNRNESG